MILALLFISILFISGCTSTEQTNDEGTNTQQGQKLQNTAPEDPTPEPVQVECPFGRVNDPYPGECGRYTDLNDDGLCDLSQ